VSKYLGDIVAGATIRGAFNTRDTDGAPITLAGTPLLRVYKNLDDTEDDSGITLNVDDDGRSGFHRFEIDTSADGTFYAAGNDFMIVITQGTVDTVSVVGVVVATFSVENRNDKADVREFGGSAGTFSSGRPEVNTTHAAGTAWGSGAITAASVAADAGGEIADAVWDEAMSGHVTSGSFGQRLQGIRSGTAQAGAAGSITLDAGASAVNDFYDGMVFITGGTGAGQSRAITDYVGATKVATVSPNWVTTPDATSVWVVLPAASLPTPTAADIADAVWEEDLSDHSGTAGSTAEQLEAAGAAGDPWATALPGAYTSGQAGKIIGDNINATVGSRASQTTADAIETDTQDLQSRLPAALVSGRISADAVAISGSTNAADNVEANIGNLDATVSTRATPAQVNTEVVDVLTVDVVADSIPADGSRPTIAQAAYLLVQFMTERAVVGTTMTVRKPDGSTALMTFTLNDATSPTSITRAS
jgi:hypothetical protein